MPVIQKPRETGIPVVDALYSAEPDVSPVPLAPAIAREKYLRAALEALPKLSAKEYAKENMIRQYLNQLIQSIPQRHLDLIRNVYVAIPEEVSKYSQAKRDYIPAGIYLPRTGDVVLIKGKSGIKTPLHEVGHATEDILPDFLYGRINQFYKENPAIIRLLEEKVRGGKYNPSEIYADLYAVSLLKRALPNHPAVVYFRNYVPPDILNIPNRLYRVPYDDVLMAITFR